MKGLNLSKKKRIIAIASTVGVLCIGGVIGGLVLTGNADAESEKTDTVTIVDTKTGEEVVVDADSEEAKEAMEDPTMEVKENKTSNKSSNGNSSNSNSGSKNNGNSNSSSISGNHNSGNSNSGSSDSSNKGNGSSGNSGEGTKPSESTSRQPTHEHIWEAVYYTRTETIDYPIYGQKCNTCGYTCQGGIMEHMESSYYCGSYSTDVPIDYYTVTETRQVFSHCECSCGATRDW